MAKKEIVLALAGNPNAGKTTVFNNLTGARQHVGNWPGVTVEKKEGVCNFRDYTIKVVDLPGVYSLTAYSPDEVVARNYIIEEQPDVVVDVVDASNLERNLYLAVQIMEMEVPVIIALNMMDEAKNRKYDIDVVSLSGKLGVAVVPMVANRNRGTSELLEEVVRTTGKKGGMNGFGIEYDREIEKEILRLEEIISRTSIASRYSPRWLAVKLLEGDEEVIRKFEEVTIG